MACRLCLADRPLRQSHIIPEFLWKRTYDQKHRVYGFGGDPTNVRLLQKGLREPLLCCACEQHLGEYERYFADVWYEQRLAPASLSRDILTISGLDYRRFKLFHLSVLWRAGVSSLAEFAEVELGPHAEALRRQLLASDPGPEDRYSFMVDCLVWPATGAVIHGLVAHPIRVRLQDHRGYHFVFGGCVWHYFVSGHSTREHIDYSFNASGQLHMLRLPIGEYKPIMDIMRCRRRARR